jgi:hypothetical protein
VVAYGQTESRSLQVFFANNSFELTDETRLQLKEFVVSCENDKVLSGSIEGFTDSKASNQYNLVLSQKRAETVRAFLESEGMDLSNLDINHFGEEKPTSNNETEQGMALNRRVDIRLTFEMGALKKLNSSDKDLVLQREEEAEKVMEEEIPTREFPLPSGSIIIIKECSFKGVKMEDVTIVAQEALNGKDMLVQGLNTLDSKGKCLKSGGMVFYKYYDKNGKEIQPQKSCMPEVLIPTDDVDPDLKIYGMSNPDDKKSDWIETKTKPEVVEREGRKYYSSRALAGGVNMDKLAFPVAVITDLVKIKVKRERQIFWKTKGFDRPDVYIHNDSSCVRPAFIATRKFTHEICEPCLTSTSMVTAVAKRDGKIFYYSKPFYEHQLRRNRYKIPRKEYQLIESEEELLKLFNASNENMAVNG